MKTNRAHEKMQKRKREELKFTKTSERLYKVVMPIVRQFMLQNTESDVFRCFFPKGGGNDDQRFRRQSPETGSDAFGSTQFEVAVSDAVQSEQALPFRLEFFVGKRCVFRLPNGSVVEEQLHGEK